MLTEEAFPIQAGTRLMSCLTTIYFPKQDEVRFALRTLIVSVRHKHTQLSVPCIYQYMYGVLELLLI